MTTQSLVYKTYEIPCNVEHYAKPINLSGARTIKLTSLPSGVQCWISTENTGENKFPLINRGDGWVDLPNPLYDIYVFTKGTTLNNENIILNYTGQGDFFEYGMSSGEKIEKIGSVESVATQAVADISNAILGSGNKTKIIKTINIMGDFTFSNTYNAQGLKLYHFPLGRDTKISDLKLENDRYYRIRTIGHFDIGQARMDGDGITAWRYKTADKITKNVSMIYQNFSDDDGHDSYYCKYLYEIITQPTITYNISDIPSVNIKCKVNCTHYPSREDTCTIYPGYNKPIDIDETIQFSNIREVQSYNMVTENLNNFTQNFTYGNTNNRTWGNYYNYTKHLIFNFSITPIWDVKEISVASENSSFYDIWESAHLIACNEVDTPEFQSVDFNNISSSFENLFYSNNSPFYKEYELWGIKTRHSNKDQIINYQGTGLNANSFDMVIRGSVLNQYEKLCLEWNVTNLYNENLKITKSAANCHSSLIMEISEV